MATTGESARSTDSTENSRAIGWFLAVLLNLGAGAWLLHDAARPDTPPALAFVLFFIAALVLYILQPKESTASSVENGAGAARSRAPVLTRLRAVSRGQILLLGLSIITSLYTLHRLPQLGRIDTYTVPFIAWTLSIVCYTVALAPLRKNNVRSWWLRSRRRWRRQRASVLLLAIIVLVALILRAGFLEAIPYTLGGDEASQGLEAARILDGEIRNPFTTGWLGVPTLSFFFNSITIELLGMTKVGLRLPWALIGVATVAATFFLVRRLQGRTLALAAAALMAVYHYHIHFSRLGSNQIADPFFVALSLYFLIRALQKRDLLSWVLCGVVTGLALYFYAGARFTPVVLVAVLALWLVYQPRTLLWSHIGGIAAMVGGFLITAGPMLQYAARFPEDFNARLNQVGIIQSGWLERELQAGNELLPTLWEQFKRAALAFHYFPDRTVWYGLQEPLLDPLFGAIFAIGLFLATLLVVFRRRWSVMPFVVWWWGGMLAGGMLTESPPSSQRLTTLTIPTCFFIIFAVWHIIGLLRRAIGGVPRRLALALCVVAFAVSSINLYFFEFTPQYRYGGKHAELATGLAPVFDELQETHDVYFVGAPWMYWGFATIPYLSPHMQGQDLEQTLEEPPPRALLRAGRGGVFIVRPERAAELPFLVEAFPEGRLHELYSRGPERELLATVYIVPPGPAN